jgi:hypothetical protein
LRKTLVFTLECFCAAVHELKPLHWSPDRMAPQGSGQARTANATQSGFATQSPSQLAAWSFCQSKFPTASQVTLFSGPAYAYPNAKVGALCSCRVWRETPVPPGRRATADDSSSADAG